MNTQFSHSTRQVAFWLPALLAAFVALATRVEAQLTIIDHPSSQPMAAHSGESAIGGGLLAGCMADLCDANPETRTRGAMHLERLCAEVSATGDPGRVAALMTEMLDRLSERSPPQAWVIAIQQIERFGGPPEVDALTILLDDRDPQIVDAARRALSRNPSPRAAEALVRKLRSTTSAASQAALIAAIARRDDGIPVVTIIDALKSEHDLVVLAAIDALTSKADSLPVTALLDAAATARPAVKPALLHALARVADDRSARGDCASITKMLAVVDQPESPPAVRALVLRAALRCERERTVARLIQSVLGIAEADVAGPARQLLQEATGPAITQRIVDAFVAAESPVQQIALLEVLATRGDAAGIGIARTCATGTNDDVAAAGARALARCGRASSVETLLQIAAGELPAAAKAAREELARIPGDEVDRALIAELQKAGAAATGSATVQRIQAVRARRSADAVATLRTLLAGADEEVRRASFEAIGALAGPTELPTLLDALLRLPTGDGAAEAAEDAVCAVGMRIEPPDARAAVVVVRWPSADATAMPRLLRILARLQGPAALTIVQSAVSSNDAGVRDVALRALAGWNGDAALETLLAFAESPGDDGPRAIALDGALRMLKSSTRYTDDGRLTIIRAAFDVAPTVEIRRAALSAISEIPRMDVLQFALDRVGSSDVSDEAALAAATLARRLAARHPAEAQAAIGQLSATALGPAASKRVVEAAKFLDDFDGYIGLWEVSPVYTAADNTYAALLTTKFAPQPGGVSTSPPSDRSAVNWKPLAAPAGDNPFLMDLSSVDKGANRCVFVRTTIHREAAGSATLLIGSDDGFTAWLNGKKVAENPAQRGMKPGQDSATIQLRAGDNELVLKVLQSSGGWGFCCAIRYEVSYDGAQGF